MLIPVGGPTTPAQNRLLRAFTDLKDTDLRQKWELREGVYLGESLGVIARAVAAGHVPEAFLLSPAWLEKMAPLLEETTGSPDGGAVPVFVVEEAKSATITGYRLHRGALAVFRRPPLPHASEVLSDLSASRPRCIAVLEGIVDHTNVGAIFRSAAALGVDAVLLSPTCADPLYRRSVRVSMGAVFQVPWARIPSWPDWELFERAGYRTCALTPAPDAADLDDYLAKLPPATGTREDGGHPNLALFLGSEGPGLTPAVLSETQIRLRIPLGQGVDSLNVATAAAIAFWEARRYTRAT